ncbi:serine protease [Candidatus Kaiserbacteria bacterium]|nr:serine protease [Candidatus Kaiserbacteria bacterium]
MVKYANTLITILFVLILAIIIVGIFAYKEIAERQEAQVASLQEELELYRAETLEALGIVDAQTIALQAELSDTQENASELQAVLDEQSQQPKDIVITSADLAPYLTGIVQVLCDDTSGRTTSGSGSLWRFDSIPYAVVTNDHVVENAAFCILHITDANNNTLGVFELNTSTYNVNEDTDTAVLSIGAPLNDTTLAAWTYNYALADLRTCPSTLPAGTPVVMMGFPSYAKRNTTLELPRVGEISTIYRAVSNGIISGFDTALLKPEGSLDYHNFFVSAKIDTGNSGGMALAKDEDGLCSLGLPTWLSVGKYETQGLVQNILNVLY